MCDDWEVKAPPSFMAKNLSEVKTVQQLLELNKQPQENKEETEVDAFINKALELGPAAGLEITTTLLNHLFTYHEAIYDEFIIAKDAAAAIWAVDAVRISSAITILSDVHL